MNGGGKYRLVLLPTYSGKHTRNLLRIQNIWFLQWIKTVINLVSLKTICSTLGYLFYTQTNLGYRGIGGKLAEIRLQESFVMEPKISTVTESTLVAHVRRYRALKTCPPEKI